VCHQSQRSRRCPLSARRTDASVLARARRQIPRIGSPSRTHKLPRHDEAAEVPTATCGHSGAVDELHGLLGGDRQRKRRADAAVALQVGTLDAVDTRLPARKECPAYGPPTPTCQGIAHVGLKRDNRILRLPRMAGVRLLIRRE
jgi:hypothetical protein